MTSPAKSPSAEGHEPGFALQLRGGGLFMGGARALVYSHVAVEMLRKQLFHQVGEDLARAILAQAGRHSGFNDAQLLLQEQSFDSLSAMVAAQYELLAASGFGTFKVIDLVLEKAGGEAYVRVTCADSPEAESQRRLFGRSALPACYHLVGYSSGWASSMTGMQLLTVETRCAAKGDAFCEFETLPYADFVGPEAAFWKNSFESTGQSLAQALQEKLTTIERQVLTIERQRAALIALAAPILQIADGVLALPVIGTVDAERATVMTERLLDAIVEQRAKGVVVDVTGVERLDAQMGHHLLRMAKSARLLGVRVVVSGISPDTAKVLLEHDVDLLDIPACRTLQDAAQILQDKIRKR